VEVLADPHKLADYGLGMTDLSDAVSKGNVLQAVGQLQDNHKLYLVMADHSISTIDKIGDVVVRSDAAGIVRVRDIASVQSGVVPQWIRVVEDGKPAVLFTSMNSRMAMRCRSQPPCKPSLASSSCPPACVW